MMKTAKLFLLGMAVVLMAGCRSIGPQTITRDRFDYSAALSDSWKSQMLLNLVKTRYLDLPIFLEVGQIVSGYTLERSGTVGVGISETDAMGGNTAAFGGSARYTDRPTITYNPLTGDKFLEGFLTPLEPSKVFGLMQAGYAADFIFELSLDSLNGLRNRPGRLGGRQKSDPKFFRSLSLLSEIQDSGAVGIRVERATNGAPASVFFFRSEGIEPAVVAQIGELRELLGLSPGQSSFRLIQSPLRGGDGEIAVSTRSVAQMLTALSLGVEIPAPHLQRKIAPPIAEPPTTSGLLRVHSGEERPRDAFAAVTYEGRWFWILNDDWRSKRTFSSILFLFTLANTGGAQNAPTLTIPTQ